MKLIWVVLASCMFQQLHVNLLGLAADSLQRQKSPARDALPPAAANPRPKRLTEVSIFSTFTSLGMHST